MVELPIAPWTLPWQDVIQDLHVSPNRGLDTVEVKKRYKKFGSNRLQEVKKKSAWIILINQLKSLIILLLGVTTIVSFAFGEWVEGMAIGVVIVINTAIGFFTELKAVRSMEALRKLGSVTTKVIRNSQLREIPADELVPGDIVVFEGGMSFLRIFVS